MNYNLGDIVTMKKVHPCGSYDFEIIRLGADVKIRCVKCSRVIMIPRVELNKKIDRKSTRLNSSHNNQSRMPYSA